MSAAVSPVSPALASVLRSGRGELNARFAAARARHPGLDAEAFADFVRAAVDPLVAAVARVHSERVTDVAVAAYDIALELVGQKLVGRSARTPYVDEAWRRVLPETASLVATQPAQMIAAVCNACHQLSGTAGARPAAWIDIMCRLAGQCADATVFLTLGQVAAWRAGMAHFRRSALAAADTLPESVVLTVMGASSAQHWSDIRGRLAIDPWFDPAAPAEAPGLVRVAARAGAFRGFGGLFTEPPTVAMADEQLFVRGGAECWLLEADAFGATFHRATNEEFERARARPALPDEVSVHGTTLIIHGSKVGLSSMLDEVSSACASRTTVALTTPHTHAVLLLSIPVA